MHPILTRALAAGSALVALAVAVALGPGMAEAGARPAAGTAGAQTAGARTAGAQTAGARTAGAQTAGAQTAPSGPVRHVVLIGVPGLRWTDASAAATPALWRLARRGSVGSVSVTGVSPVSCPADGWLTLNAGARAAAPRTATGSCAPLPAVTEVRYLGGTGRRGRPDHVVLATTSIPEMAKIISSNQPYNENPAWGLLRSAAGPAGCTTAVGPGAALALASRSGQLGSFLPGPAGLTQADVARCPLTVADLGNSAANPRAANPRAANPRAVSVRADDREIGRITASLPASTLVVVAGMSDDAAPHLQLLVVSGPGFGSGLLVSPSTRQRGLALLLDLPVSVLHWLGRPVPPGAMGQVLHRASRSSLATAVSGLLGQDTAAQVYRATMPRFFLVVGLGYAALFTLIAVFPWGRGQGPGRGETRGRRRRVVARVAGVWAASVPAGSFLASLVPWWTRPHPAVLLYTMTVAWALAIAVAALTGPWRRDPLGPPGLVAAVTLGVIALDVMTGSHLQMGTPFGLSALVAGRFYGIGNNAVEIYAASGLLLAAWLGGAALRGGGPVLNRAAARRRALLVMAAVTVFTVVAAGWPGFGAKVGGTIAMVPGFLLLMAAVAGVRITVRRGLLVAVSGLAVVVVFAVLNYALPGTGHSDIGAFVGQVLHGGASGTLHRKISSNLGSLSESTWSLVIPVALAAAGVVVFWPARARARLLVRGYQAVPLLRPALAAIWLTGVLGWFAEDSGVTVPAAGFPLVLPLMIVILSSLPRRPEGPRPRALAREDDQQAASAAADPGYL